MLWYRMGNGVRWVSFLAMIGGCTMAVGQESRFAKTQSRSQYVHWIDLYDANEKRIDPTDPKAPPYSPVFTCGRCHDYDAISHGYHFNAGDKLAEAGRSGEPWIWTDTRTGTQIPLSYRGWPGTYRPEQLGITPWDFVLKFGRQLAGGGPGELAGGDEPSARAVQQAAIPNADEKAENDDKKVDDSNDDADQKTGSSDAKEPDEETGRWQLSGLLNVDCMFCHRADSAYSPEVWWDQIQKQNFAWAPAASLGLADVAGEVSKLPDDFDAAKAGDSDTGLPRTTYKPLRINAEKKVFFDVIGKPSKNTCYYCHTARVVGRRASPQWTHDEDVHIRAGMTCSDCHRNGIDHNTVRGYQGERHSSGLPVMTLSCRGCHLGEHAGSVDLPGGRMGAPKPEHRGLPPLHLERLACTTCHSGPRPSKDVLQLQTAMAHGLGLPSHHYGAELAPFIVAPVLMRHEETLFPYRMMWPAFWGTLDGEEIIPLNPEIVQGALRKTLRVRRNSTFVQTMSKVRLSADDKAKMLGDDRAKVPESEWTEQEKAKIATLEKKKASEAFREKLVKAFSALKKVISKQGAMPVYVSGGRVYRLDQEGSVKTFNHEAAEPYAWPLAHDVRPARWSSGVNGCYECHSAGAPLFEGNVTAMGPAPDAKPITRKMYELANYDKQKLDAWNLSFQGRTVFKWFGFVSAGIVGLVVLTFLLVTIGGLFGLVRR